MKAYWKKNLMTLLFLLLIWFTVSFGFGILSFSSFGLAKNNKKKPHFSINSQSMQPEREFSNLA